MRFTFSPADNSPDSSVLLCAKCGCLAQTETQLLTYGEYRYATCPQCGAKQTFSIIKEKDGKIMAKPVD